MKSEQLPSHGGVWKTEFDVTLDAAQQRGIVVFKQVRGHDHHTIEPVELLHQAVAVLVDAGGTASVLDNNINDNNDGSQPGGPGTPLYSPVVNLTGGAESITDGDADADTNLSIDFGLWGSVAVGNFVFLDINGDGVRNEGESLGNIFVELYAQGAVPGVDEPIGVGSSGCSCKGRYYIEGLNP
jgi:hypothetical protein